MKTDCAWCGKRMRGFFGRTSHGICRACLALQYPEIYAEDGVHRDYDRGKLWRWVAASVCLVIALAIAWAVA